MLQLMDKKRKYIFTLTYFLYLELSMISAFENKVDPEQLATFDKDPHEFLCSCL